MAKGASSKHPGKRRERTSHGRKSVRHEAGSKKTLEESAKGDEKRSRRKAQAARDQYQQNPPSTEQLELLIVTLIREAQKPLAERKGQTGAEGTRDIVQLAAEVLEERGPMLGASMEEIIWAVHKEFPGTPWSRIRNVVLSLEKEGQIHLDHEESQRRGVSVWRIGPPKPVPAGQQQAQTGASIDEQDGPPEGLRIDTGARLAYWDGIRLPINANADFDALAELYENLGSMVPHLDLARAVKPKAFSEGVQELNAAPPEVKEAIGHIRKAFGNAKVSWFLETVKGKGYRLRSPDE